MKKEFKSVNSYFIYFTYYTEDLSWIQRYTNTFISSILCYIIIIKSVLTFHSRRELCRVKTIEFMFVQIRIQQPPDMLDFYTLRTTQICS